MIIGSINADREAVLPLGVQNGAETQDYEAVIDTGFNGYLTLSSTEIIKLNLPFQSQVVVTLGEGTQANLREFLATVNWDGQPRDILVLEAEGEPLVGMALLYGSDVWLRILDGGHVRIEAVPANGD